MAREALAFYPIRRYFDATAHAEIKHHKQRTLCVYIYMPKRVSRRSKVSAGITSIRGVGSPTYLHTCNNFQSLRKNAGVTNTVNERFWRQSRCR